MTSKWLNGTKDKRNQWNKVYGHRGNTFLTSHRLGQRFYSFEFQSIHSNRSIQVAARIKFTRRRHASGLNHRDRLCLLLHGQKTQIWALWFSFKFSTISITGFTIILPSKTTGPVQSSERRRHLLHWICQMQPSLLEFCEEWTACSTQSILLLMWLLWGDWRKFTDTVHGCWRMWQNVEDCYQVRLWMRVFKIRLWSLREKNCK